MSQNQENIEERSMSEEDRDIASEMEVNQRRKVAHAIVKESQKAEAQVTNDIPVSVFRLKLLEAQLQENMVHHTNEFSQGFDQNSELNGEFLNEIDEKIEELRQWRKDRDQSLGGEFNLNDEDLKADFTCNLHEPETIDEEDYELVEAIPEEPSKFDSLQLLLNDLKQGTHREESEDEKSQLSTDSYRNYMVDANRIEHEARFQSRVPQPRPEEMSARLETERELDAINLSVESFTFELDQILSRC